MALKQGICWAFNADLWWFNIWIAEWAKLRPFIPEVRFTGRLVVLQVCKESYLKLWHGLWTISLSMLQYRLNGSFRASLHACAAGSALRPGRAWAGWAGPASFSPCEDDVELEEVEEPLSDSESDAIWGRFCRKAGKLCFTESWMAWHPQPIPGIPRVRRPARTAGSWSDKDT